MAETMVDELAENFCAAVQRALGVDLDGTPTSLAFVDHYLSLARDEERAPIVSLLAAEAGAYFGQLVRTNIGATWIGDGKDPRRLRLLVVPQFIHFSPVDQVFEAIAGRGLDEDDPRIPAGPPFDPAFNLRPVEADSGGDSEADALWLEARLAQLAPVPEDEFHSLTCRFETLQLMLELLAAKHVGEGLRPQQYRVEDYLKVFSARPV